MFKKIKLGSKCNSITILNIIEFFYTRVSEYENFEIPRTRIFFPLDNMAKAVCNAAICSECKKRWKKRRGRLESNFSRVSIQPHEVRRGDVKIETLVR